MNKGRKRYGDILSMQWLVMLGDKVLATCDTEQQADQVAERRGGTVKRIEWKLGGRL